MQDGGWNIADGGWRIEDPRSSILHPLSSIFLLAALCSFLFFYRLGHRDLWSSHEARAAQDAQSTLDADRWGLPRLFDRKVELQKPPVYYWLVAGLAKLRGGPVDAWSVRMPSALAGLLGVVLVYGFAWRCGRPLAGFVAGAVLATAQHYTWLSRVGRIDMPLTFAVSVTLLAYYRGWAGRRETNTWSWRWMLLAYVGAAAAILLKGPIGLVLSAVVIAAHLLLERIASPPRSASEDLLRACWGFGLATLNLIHQLGLWWGLPLVFALTAPLYWWANAQTDGAFGQVFFWYHNFERGFGEAGTLASHPWWFYGPHLVWDFLPWSPLVLVGVWWLLRNSRWRMDAEARFGLVWLVAMLAFLSCMSFKRSDYLLPAFPGAALFVGCVAERWLRRSGCQPVQASRTSWQPVLRRAGFLAIVFLVVPVSWWIQLNHRLPAQEPARERRSFAAEIRRLVPQPSSVKLFRVEDHALAFHLGPKIDTILEWENLDVWAGRPGTYIVMPPECAREWPEHLRSGRLEEVLRNTDLSGGRHEHPLILLRSCAPAGRRAGE